MISSADLKLYSSLKQKKYREESGKFLIEGFHLIEECLNSSYSLSLIIIRDDIYLENYTAVSKKVKSKKVLVESLPVKTFNKLSETENSQGIIGVVSKKRSSQENIKAASKPELIVALDRITDPGNLGTIIRTSYWYGVGKILVSGNSVDIYNSKVIRASQGAIFHINIEDNTDLHGKLHEMKEHGYKIYLVTLNGKQNLDGIIKSNRSVFVFGNEAGGIAEELVNLGFHTLKIEGNSDCESLNVSVAAGIVLYEFRQIGK